MPRDTTGFIAALSIGLMAGLAFVLTLLFLVAYFNGGQTMFYIDRYGEADLELVVLAVVWALAVPGLYHAYVRIAEA